MGASRITYNDGESQWRGTWSSGEAHAGSFEKAAEENDKPATGGLRRRTPRRHSQGVGSKWQTVTTLHAIKWGQGRTFLQKGLVSQRSKATSDATKLGDPERNPRRAAVFPVRHTCYAPLRNSLVSGRQVKTDYSRPVGPPPWFPQSAASINWAALVTSLHPEELRRQQLMQQSDPAATPEPPREEQ